MYRPRADSAEEVEFEKMLSIGERCIRHYQTLLVNKANELVRKATENPDTLMQKQTPKAK